MSTLLGFNRPPKSHSCTGRRLFTHLFLKHLIKCATCPSVLGVGVTQEYALVTYTPPIPFHGHQCPREGEKAVQSLAQDQTHIGVLKVPWSLALLPGFKSKLHCLSLALSSSVFPSVKWEP